MNAMRGFIVAAAVCAAAFLSPTASPATESPGGNAVGNQSAEAPTSTLTQSDTLFLYTKRLMVYNTGRLGGGNDGASLDIPGDCDADLAVPNGDMYLRDASPMIVFNDGSGNKAYTAVFSQSETEPGTFFPRSGLNFIFTPDYTQVVCTLSTTDSLFDVIASLWVPTGLEADFVAAQYQFKAHQPGGRGMDEVYIGFIANWDIPSDVDGWNGSDYDEPANEVYQFGHEADEGDTDEDAPHSCPITENERFGGISVVNGTPRTTWTAANAPMQEGSGFNNDSLFARASASGYNIYSPSDTFDLHTGITFDKVDMSVDSTYDFTVVLATTNAGIYGLMSQLELGNAWAYSLLYEPPSCCEVPGDIDHNGTCNVADVVRLICWIFGTCPPPPCMDEADANADCALNIGDGVYLINYIFKGGPAPRCGCVP